MHIVLKLCKLFSEVSASADPFHCTVIQKLLRLFRMTRKPREGDIRELKSKNNSHRTREPGPLYHLRLSCFRVNFTIVKLLEGFPLSTKKLKLPFLSFFGLVLLGFNISPIPTACPLKKQIICFPWQFFRMFSSQHVRLKWPHERR